MAKSKAVQLVEEITGQVYDSAPVGFTKVSTGGVLSRAGDIVSGIYKGKGKPKLIRKKMVETYTVESEKLGEVSILASAQIAPLLDARKVGDEVWIQRRGQVQGGKGRVNQFDFAFKPGKK